MESEDRGPAMRSWSPQSRQFLQEVYSAFGKYKSITRGNDMIDKQDQQIIKRRRQGDDKQAILNTKIGIGKYADSTIKYVINCDISYIGWILNNKEISAEEDGGGLSRVKYIIKDVLKNA